MSVPCDKYLRHLSLVYSNQTTALSGVNCRVRSSGLRIAFALAKCHAFTMPGMCANDAHRPYDKRNDVKAWEVFITLK